jgi:hypothetical protein
MSATAATARTTAGRAGPNSRSRTRSTIASEEEDGVVDAAAVSTTNNDDDDATRAVHGSDPAGGNHHPRQGGAATAAAGKENGRGVGGGVGGGDGDASYLDRIRAKVAAKDAAKQEKEAHKKKHTADNNNGNAAGSVVVLKKSSGELKALKEEEGCTFKPDLPACPQFIHRLAHGFRQQQRKAKAYGASERAKGGGHSTGLNIGERGLVGKNVGPGWRTVAATDGTAHGCKWGKVVVTDSSVALLSLERASATLSAARGKHHPHGEFA